MKAKMIFQQRKINRHKMLMEKEGTICLFEYTGHAILKKVKTNKDENSKKLPITRNIYFLTS